MHTDGRAEAERLLGIADKLLQAKDLNGARDFAILAQETEPLLEGSDQILAVVDVLIAGDKRIKSQNDWYSILQLESPNDDTDLVKRQYRRLALLLHPDKNKYVFADAAFKLVAEAWVVLSDPSRKIAYDNELFAFSKVDLVAMKKEGEKGEDQNHQISRDKIPVTRLDGRASTNIWTACPYCYNMYEYPRVYDGYCLRCVNCQRAFQVVVIPPASLPPTVPGKEAYYCYWGNFPMGFAMTNSLQNDRNMPVAGPGEDSVVGPPPAADRYPTPPIPTAGSKVAKKRGRPRKNPLP